MAGAPDAAAVVAVDEVSLLLLPLPHPESIATAQIAANEDEKRL
jgi:hypothetical protein